jgi:peptidoglycan pentaglycine glycine transferase (the first glycine)
MTANVPSTLTDHSNVKHVDDASSWDASIARLGGHLLQTWNWGEFKSLHGWIPVRLILESENQPRIAAQILFRGVGPFAAAYVPRGPLASDLSPGELAAFTQAIDVECRKRRGIAILIEPETAGLPMSLGSSALWTPNDVIVQPRRTIKVCVQNSDDELLGRMKPKTRYNVRLAQRRGVTVRRGGIQDIPSFYRLLEETAARDEFGIHAIDYFDDLVRVFGDDSALFIAEYDDEPAAGLLALRTPREVIYMYGATRSEHQRHMPAYLIQFRAMQWARDSGCQMYDFWGIPASDTPPDDRADSGSSINIRDGMWGVYRFKQGFGGDVVSYPGMYERVYAKPLMRAWRTLRPNLL